MSASTFARRRAADEGLQEKLSPRQLSRYLVSICRDAGRRAQMAQAMRSMAHPDAAEKVADLVEKAAGR